MSIKKYVYLSMHKYFVDRGFILKYSQIESPRTADDIRHRIIRQVFKDLQIDSVDFNSSADVPAGTGLGSSSAFTVGLLNLCYAYKGIYTSKSNLAHLACEVELQKLAEPIGKQDQYGCALGGLNLIEFENDGTVTHENVPLNQAQRRKMEESLVMFYLGGTRSASELLSTQARNSISNGQVVENLKAMAEQARTLRKDLCEDVNRLGPYLHEGWERKRRLSSEISNPLIEDAYARALAAGATGGKLLGAGGCGFLLTFVPDGFRAAVIDALSEFDSHPVQMDTAGATIIYSD